MKTLPLFLIFVLGSASPGLAQPDPSSSESSTSDVIPGGSSGSGEVEQIESIFQDDQKEDALPAAPTERISIPTETMSQVRRLEPFKDIAVIQKRYLPKTKRFELFGGGGLIMNDAFFTNAAFDFRLGYNFNESYGIEFVGKSVTTNQKDITKDLKSQKGVTTETLVTPLSYYGADFKWTPYFGKISWLNHSIVPFDHYFLLGAGSTSTNQSTSATSLHLGTGQVYALSKRFAFRWDLSWMFYNTSSGVTGTSETSNYNNLYMTVGLSWFFPEATYR